MKKLGIFFNFIFLYSFVFAQVQTEIKFDKTEYDFGEIKEENGPVTCEFTFKNIGKSPYVIKHIETSCNCTTPAYSTNPIKPGKSGFIKATFKPENHDGVFSKLLTVQGNSSTGDIYLTIRGIVIPHPRTVNDDYPTKLGNLRFTGGNILLGEIFSDKIDTGFIKVYNPTSKVITVQSMKSPIHIWSKFLPRRINPKDKIMIQFYYSPYLKKDMGYVFDRVQLITDDTEMPEKELLIVADIKKNYGKMSPEQRLNAPKIKFEVTEHNFGNIAEGTDNEFNFKFKNAGKDELFIYDTKSSCGCTASTLLNNKIVGGDSSTVNVVFHSKDKQGAQEKSITVFSNDPDNPQINLIIKANVFITTHQNKEKEIQNPNNK